jgi:hypothetical protein
VLRGSSHMLVEAVLWCAFGEGAEQAALVSAPAAVSFMWSVCTKHNVAAPSRFLPTANYSWLVVTHSHTPLSPLPPLIAVMLCQMAKSLLGFPLRPDGPPLAFDFDGPPTKEEQQQGPRRKRPAPEAAEEEGEEEGPPVVAPKRPALQGPVGPPFSRWVWGTEWKEGTAGEGLQVRWLTCSLLYCGSASMNRTGTSRNPHAGPVF